MLLKRLGILVCGILSRWQAASPSALTAAVLGLCAAAVLFTVFKVWRGWRRAEREERGRAASGETPKAVQFTRLHRASARVVPTV